jgi:hypothetical protein
VSGCGGLGMYTCLCGGDLCICLNYGYVDCQGCEDCEPHDGFDDGEDDDAADTQRGDK